MSDTATASPSMPRRAQTFVAILALTADAIAVWAWMVDHSSPSAKWYALVGFVGLLAVAESMDVRFRLHNDIEAFNLLEAVLTPMIFAFSGPLVMATVVIAQLATGVFRHNNRIKLLFNAAQWALAAGLGRLTMEALRNGDDLTPRNIAALLAAMLVVGIVNQIAVTIVIGLAQRKSLVGTLSTLSPVILPGWCVAWGLNTLVGLLFTVAFVSNPVSVVLFFVPLGVLYAAYRSYANIESDRMRLGGLQRASQLLADPDRPDQAIAEFLVEVSEAFQAGTAELLFRQGNDVVVHAINDSSLRSYAEQTQTYDASSLRSRLVALDHTVRISSESDEIDLREEMVTGELIESLNAEDHRDCLATPLPPEGGVTGALVLYDQSGLQGFEKGERAVLEALARETTSGFVKGRMTTAIKEERSRINQLVETTSDGIFTIDRNGVIHAWNKAWEQMSGTSAYSALGRSVDELVRFTDAAGTRVRLTTWPGRIDLIPPQLQIRDGNGETHHLECTYRTERREGWEAPLLTVVAHDATDVYQIEQLKEDVGRLAELESAQRQRVLQLQESLQPDPPDNASADFGVHYLPSDSNSPTGGDFYDWQMLPNGDVHIAVVDVLGHGVEATNDAFAVIHTLRTLALQGVPVERLIGSADELLAILNQELVATVITARYRPATGVLRLAGGGHPPALVVRSNGHVDQAASPGIPIGWPGAGSEFYVDVTLATGDTVVLYTDGLIEARRDIIQGLDELAATAAETRHFTASDQARTLVERSLEGADRRDDSLALVIRQRAPESN